MTIIIDPQNSGISGNMFIGALVDLGADKERIIEITEKISKDFGGVKTTIEKVNKNGISSYYCNIEVLDKENPNNHAIEYCTLVEKIDNLKNILPFEVIEKSKEVFKEIANAESKVHGKSIQEIHFHEVGAADAVCDVIGTIYGLYLLDGLDEEIIGLPISVGGGRVETSHGIVSIPAPATLEILKGLKFKGGPVDSELATPTGTALYKVLCTKYLDFIDSVEIINTGYGAGSKDFNHPNVLRILKTKSQNKINNAKTSVNVLETNIDHLSGEELGYLYDILLDAGARDVIMIPIFMKKNRPGQLIQVICKNEYVEDLIEILFKHTQTLGIRISPKIHRGTAKREFVKLPLIIEDKKFEVTFKIGYYNNKLISKRAEYEDKKYIANNTGLSINEVDELCNIIIRDYLLENKSK